MLVCDSETHGCISGSAPVPTRRWVTSAPATMIKIVVNSPKGGVGKTTLAMNAALYLAGAGNRVWALDLAQSGLMAQQLRATNEFADAGSTAVTVDPMGDL